MEINLQTRTLLRNLSPGECIIWHFCSPSNPFLLNEMCFNQDIHGGYKCARYVSNAIGLNGVNKV